MRLQPEHSGNAGEDWLLRRMSAPREPWRIVWILACTQVISWGSLYYAFAVLAPEIQRELGWRPEIVFGAFSWSLLVAGLVSTPTGILLDRWGGRSIMGLGSALAGLGLIVLGNTYSVADYFLAWTILGIATALVLYDAAFATINREFNSNARRGISTLTLFGGLASTVFWPLTLALNGAFGWRDTYLIYAITHLALCLPLHLLLRPVRPRARRADAAVGVELVRSFTLAEAVRHPVFWKLAFAFAANTFIFSSMSVHLLPLLHELGHPLAVAVFAAALIGPMQVAGRIGELAVASRTRPQTVGATALALLPVALLVLMLIGEHYAVMILFCVLYGLSNGIMTIARGTVPHALFGRDNYGAITGALAGPALIAKAAGPVVIAFVVAANPSPQITLVILLLVAVASLGCYLAAIRSGNAQTAGVHS